MLESKEIIEKIYPELEITSIVNINPYHILINNEKEFYVFDQKQIDTIINNMFKNKTIILDFIFMNFSINQCILSNILNINRLMQLKDFTKISDFLKYYNLRMNDKMIVLYKKLINKEILKFDEFIDEIMNFELMKIKVNKPLLVYYFIQLKIDKNITNRKKVNDYYIFY